MAGIAYGTPAEKPKTNKTETTKPVEAAASKEAAKND